MNKLKLFNKIFLAVVFVLLAGSFISVSKAYAVVSSFTDTFSVARYLNTDPNYVKFGGNPELYASGATLGPGTCTTASNMYAKYRTSDTFTSPNYSVSMYISGGVTAYYHLALFTRVQDEMNNYFVNVEFGNAVYVGKVVSGSNNYNTIFASPSIGDTLTLKVEGSTLSVLWGGIVRGTYTDASNTFPTAGYAGFGMGLMAYVPNSGAASSGCLSTQAYDNFSVSTNSPPTISINPSSSYGSYTRTGPSNTPFTVSFRANDSEQTGSNALTYYIHTGANRTGTQVATGNATSGVTVNRTLAYNSTGLSQGSNTLYLSIYDGTVYSSANPSFTVLRDDTAPTAATSISTTPSTPTSNSYTVTFTPNDALSTNSNEISYKICTANDTCASPITGGTGTSTSGASKTTGTLTDSALVNGANNRWVRTCDGANNCTNTGFTVTADFKPAVTTSAAGSITANSAILNSTINPNGASTNVSYLWGTTPGVECSLQPNTLAGPTGLTGTSNLSGATTQATLPSLTGNTTYYFCVMATNSYGTNYGSVTSFTTSPNTAAYTWLPDAQKLSATTDCQDNPSGAPCAPVNSSGTNGTNPTAAAASTTQINLAWGVNSVGGAGPAVTGYDVQICGLNDSTCASVDSTVSVSSATFSYNNSGITCSASPYYYRIVAKGANGNTPSNIFSGTTSTCASAPSVTTSPAVIVNGTTIQFQSNVNPNGAATTVYYRYNTSNTGNCATLGGSTLTYGGIGSGVTNVSPNAYNVGVSTGTTYYYCAYATNSVNTTYGAVVSFSICSRDADGDGYGSQSGPYAICGTGGYTYNTSDCYDGNANAYPGQANNFPTNRGDGSFDYNCDSTITYSATNTYYAGNGPYSYAASTWYPNGGCYGYSTYPPATTYTTSLLGPGTPACGTYMTGWGGYYTLYSNSSCSSFVGYSTIAQQSCR